MGFEAKKKKKNNETFRKHNRIDSFFTHEIMIIENVAFYSFQIYDALLHRILNIICFMPHTLYGISL